MLFQWKMVNFYDLLHLVSSYQILTAAFWMQGNLFDQKYSNKKYINTGKKTAPLNEQRVKSTVNTYIYIYKVIV